MSYIEKISELSRSFTAGIGSLASFAAPPRVQHTASDSELIRRAWQDVGDSIRGGMADYERQQSDTYSQKS